MTHLGQKFIPISDNRDFEGLLSTMILRPEDEPSLEPGIYATMKHIRIWTEENNENHKPGKE